MRIKTILLIALVIGVLFGCGKDEETTTSTTTPISDGNVDVILTLSNDDTLSFTMHDAEFIFSCGLEGGAVEDAFWAIRGQEISNGNETLEVAWLNIIMDDISMLNPPYIYDGGPQSGEGFNAVYRNGVEYTITMASYSIETYTVIDPDFDTYKAEATGSYSIMIESPTGEQESILISFDPIIQSNYGGGC